MVGDNNSKHYQQGKDNEKYERRTLDKFKEKTVPFHIVQVGRASGLLNY